MAMYTKPDAQQNLNPVRAVVGTPVPTGTGNPGIVRPDYNQADTDHTLLYGRLDSAFKDDTWDTTP